MESKIVSLIETESNGDYQPLGEMGRCPSRCTIFHLHKVSKFQKSNVQHCAYITLQLTILYCVLEICQGKVKHLETTYLLATCMSSWEKCLFRSFAHLLSMCCSVILWLVSSLGETCFWITLSSFNWMIFQRHGQATYKDSCVTFVDCR